MGAADVESDAVVAGAEEIDGLGEGGGGDGVAASIAGEGVAGDESGGVETWQRSAEAESKEDDEDGDEVKHLDGRCKCS